MGDNLKSCFALMERVLGLFLITNTLLSRYHDSLIV